VSAAPPFRAEHIGSLLRPPELLETRRRFDAGEASAEELAAVEDRCIEGAVRLQERVGLQAITDGEYRRLIYFGHFPAAVSGFTDMEAELQFTDETGRRMKYMTPVVTGKLRRLRGIATDEFAYVRSLTKRTPKVTLPSPCSQHFFRWREGVSEQVYPHLDDFFADVAAVYREELAALGTLDATYVQLDDVSLPMLCDDPARERFRQRGYDPSAILDNYIEVVNESIRDRPRGMVVGIHMCRGNNQGRWLGEGGYDFVAEQVFRQLNVDVFFLEYDSPRAGSFVPLRYVPDDKFVVLGLVTTKKPELESAEELTRRIAEASAYVPLERLGLSPQCGFASTAPGNPLTAAEQEAKLRLVCQVAGEVWQA
jgi:5-methyltetrahydropteroyltriglutamate--homocysteine methyltransferase